VDIASVLSDILVVLVAAKLAAELAERIGVPAVVGEIVAGVLVGPSVLGLVGHQDEVLRTLGEIGVILLLLEVGMEMDLGELTKVGRVSLLVATAGVVAPLVLGLGAMQLLEGDSFNTSLFIGAALTATSVGITARVFGDLRALATTEARVVLGAAVADDVMGLVVLTVVVRLVTEGSVSIGSVGLIIAVAVGFLVIGGLGGLRLSGPLFDAVHRVSRSTGTMVAVALAFTLAFARIADAAKLAPIVGAFVAGIALTRSDQSDRIRRELAPVGHLFIPVFFLQIGIDAEVGAFGRVEVLGTAAVLLVVAVVGKLISPVGAIGSKGDKLLIGLGMLPRGEVGLIFATIGLSNGVLDDDLYAALLLVVLVTTLATPQLLKLRYGRLRASAAVTAAVGADPEPPGGWFRVDGEVELAARPPESIALELALRSAILVGRRDPGEALSNWLATMPAAALAWRRDAFDELLDAIERGNARSWRYLDTTGVLDAALPTISAALRQRRGDSLSVDLLESYRMPSLEQLRKLDPGDPVGVEVARVLDADALLLALFLVDALDAVADPAGRARQTLTHLGVGDARQSEIGDLVADAPLLWGAALRAGAFAEEAVVQLASHLGTTDHARALFVISALRGADRPPWAQARLRELYRLVQEVLGHDLHDEAGRDVLDLRRSEALALVEDESVRERIRRAPRPYLARKQPSVLARQAAMLVPALSGRGVRVQVASAAADDEWWVDVAARDRHGLLATVTEVLCAAQLDVIEAVVATWPDRMALESFLVRSPEPPEANALELAIGAAAEAGLTSEPLVGAEVLFDNDASPWHTVCEVVAPDQVGLLHVIATAFAAAEVDVVAATIVVHEGQGDDRFEVVDRDGNKLDDSAFDAVRWYLEHGVRSKRGWFGRQRFVTASGVGGPRPT
jgi:Kef-type K+ transport system membrane component KefB